MRGIKMDNSAKKHSILWWIGRVLLWIVFFPVMFMLFLIRTKKLPIPVKIPFLLAHIGLWAIAGYIGFLSDNQPPVIEARETAANYGTTIELKDVAVISDEKDDAPSMAITYCDPKAGTIGDDGQSVTFSKVGDYTIRVTGQDSSENVAELEIPVKITDGTPPVIKAKKAELSVMDSIPVSDLAAAKDEVDSSPELKIIACDGDAEIAKGGKSIVFKETGDYTVGLMATDSSDNGVKDKVTVRVFNDTIPDIKLSKTAISISDTDKDVDFTKYVSSESAVYGDLTGDVVIDSSAVKYGIPGKYTVNYSVSDKDGNKNRAELEVTVKDTTAPSISIFSTEFVLTEGDGKPDYLSGLTASDSNEGDLTGKVKVDDSAVDYNKAGTYVVVYSVVDSAGNAAKHEATVTVREKAAERSIPSSDNNGSQTSDGDVGSQTTAENIGAQTSEAVSGQGVPNRDVQADHPDTETEATYILNKNTGKFHYPWCASVKTMKEKNAEYFSGTRDEAIARGYDPCKRCNP